MSTGSKLAARTGIRRITLSHVWTSWEALTQLTIAWKGLCEDSHYHTLGLMCVAGWKEHTHTLTSRHTAAICGSVMQVSVTTSVRDPPAKYSITTCMASLMLASKTSLLPPAPPPHPTPSIHTYLEKHSQSSFPEPLKNTILLTHYCYFNGIVLYMSQYSPFGKLVQYRQWQQVVQLNSQIIQFCPWPVHTLNKSAAEVRVI